MAAMKALLFYTIGYPGAGKTTFARQLSRWFNGVHLQADKIGMRLFVVPTFSEAERQTVYQHMDYQATGALSAGHIVLYDGTLNTREQREHLRQLAAQCGTQAIGLWVALPVDIARKRAARIRNAGEGQIAGRVVPPAVFERHVAAFQAPAQGEIVAKVDGMQPFGFQYRNLRRQLAQTGIALPKIIEL